MISGSGCGLQVEGGWGLGGFQVVIQVDKGFVGVRGRANASSMEEKEC